MTDLRKLLIEARKMLDHFLGDDSCMCQACLLCRSIDSALAEPVEPLDDLNGLLDCLEATQAAYETASGLECEKLDKERLRCRSKIRALFSAPAEQDRVDAERYRWIRENGDKGIFVFDPDKKPRIELAQRDELDTLIDRERSAK